MARHKTNDLATRSFAGADAGGRVLKYQDLSSWVRELEALAAEKVAGGIGFAVCYGFGGDEVIWVGEREDV